MYIIYEKFKGLTMKIIMTGEVREKKTNSLPNPTSNQIMPTIWANSAKLVMDKSAKEIESFKAFKSFDSTKKEKMAKNNLWNKLLSLRANTRILYIGPLSMQLRSEELEEAKNITVKEQAIEKVKNYGGYLEYLPEQFKDDEDIVALAMVNDTYNFCYASERIRSDKETVFTFLQYNDYLFEGISESLKKEIGGNNPTSYLESYFLNKELQESIPDKSENGRANSKIKI
jgi:hypothetical protein